MVTCRRLTPGSNRKKRHVRHVHSRRHLARRFATHRACFQKEYFIDEKVRFNRARQQGFGVQIISGAHKPNQAGHKWNQLKVVTNALLDVALTASSAFMRAIPLIEEGVQHVHPVNKHLQSFLRSWTHEAFFGAKARNYLFARGRAFLEVLGPLLPDELHSCRSSSSQQLGT